VQWREANAEALPFGDGEFDAVLSCIGVMFAPHHQDSADEMIRVCRSGGTIAIASWTPEGFIGQLFATMKPYVAAPPPGVSSPPLWGSEDHVRRLFGDRVDDVVTERRGLAVDRFADGSAFRDYFKANYGPTIAAYRGIADQPDRVAALDADIARLGDAALADASTMEWEYLVVVARKR
jgi:SAM-dependent methyltransferase